MTKPFTVSSLFKQLFDKANEIMGCDQDDIAWQKEDIKSGRYPLDHWERFYRLIVDRK